MGRSAPSEPYCQQVLDLLRWSGFTAVHFRAGQNRRGSWSVAMEGDGEGFPDILAVSGRHLLAIEVKRDGEGPTPEQWDWLVRFREADAICWVLRPADGFDWAKGVERGGCPAPPVYGWNPQERPQPPKAPNPYRNRPQARQRPPGGLSRQTGSNCPICVGGNGPLCASHFG